MLAESPVSTFEAGLEWSDVEMSPVGTLSDSSGLSGIIEIPFRCSPSKAEGPVDTHHHSDCDTDSIWELELSESDSSLTELVPPSSNKRLKCERHVPCSSFSA